MAEDTAVLPVEHRLEFPPFPEPPPGAIIPVWSTFKPAGIRLVQDDSDEPEVDGRGIPTIKLASSHGLTEAEKMRGGKSKKKKNRTTVAGPDGKLVRLTWYEEWELNELGRKTFINT